jgi:hypothetical protein
MAEDLDVTREVDLASYCARGIMISFDDVNRNLSLSQAGSLAHEKEPGAGVSPIAVPEITGDYYEGDVLPDGEVNKVFEGSARCHAYLIDRRILEKLKTPQRAVEVDISGVYELEHDVLQSSISVFISKKLASSRTVAFFICVTVLALHARQPAAGCGSLKARGHPNDKSFRYNT